MAMSKIYKSIHIKNRCYTNKNMYILLNLNIQVQKCLVKFQIAIMYCSYMICAESAAAKAYVMMTA